MAYREFLDTDGLPCKVWDTYPTAHKQLHVAAPLANGWLAFETGDTRRRLYPVPPGWEAASEHQLRYWLSIAELRPRNPAAGDAGQEPEPVPRHVGSAEGDPLPASRPGGELVALTRAIIERSRRTLAAIEQAVGRR